MLTTALRAHIQSIHNDINESVDGVEHLPEVALDTSALGLAGQATRVKSMPLMDRRIALAQVFVALDRHLFGDHSWNPRDPLPGVDGQPHHAVARTTVLAEFAGALDKLSEADQSAGMFPLARRGHVVAEARYRLRSLDKATHRRMALAVEAARKRGAAIRLMAPTPTIDFKGQPQIPKGGQLARMGPPDADHLVVES